MNTQNKKMELTSFSLHIIAMVLMLCDHLWGTFFLAYDWLTYLGRIAFPIFAFLLVEGFFHTGNKKKYLQRILIFALISEIPFNLMVARNFIYPIHQNVLWAFLLGILMMNTYEKIRSKHKFVIKILLLLLTTIGFYLLGIVFFVDYYGYGILTIALFYFTHSAKEDALMNALFKKIIQVFGMYWINCEMMAGLVITLNIFGFPFEIHKQGLALLALPLIWLYRGKQGYYNKAVKNIYYWFYPAHIFILGLLYTILSA